MASFAESKSKPSGSRFMPLLPSLRFYMMRHGETVANVQNVAAGSFDTPLTDKGRNQAKNARKNFESLSPRPALIAHSPLSRTKETTQILNESLGLPLLEVPSITERSFGDWRGEPWPFVHERIMAGHTPPGGESRADMIARVFEGLTYILSLPQTPALIVTHGGVFDALLQGLGHEPFDAENCGLYAFTPKGADFSWQIQTASLIASYAT